MQVALDGLMISAGAVNPRGELIRDTVDSNNN